MVDFFIAPVYLWLILMVVCFIVEVFTLTFSLLSFGIAAGLTALVSLMGFHLSTQLIVFSVVSVLSICFVRPIATKLLFNKKNQPKLGIEAYIGQQHKLIEAVNNIDGTGKIKLGSEIWTARSKEQININKEEVVEIKSIEGTTLFVEKIDTHKE